MASTSPFASADALGKTVSFRLLCYHAIRTTNGDAGRYHAMQDALFEKGY